MQGSKFLKVTGILMIIGGVLALIVAIVALISLVAATLSNLAAFSTLVVNNDVLFLWFAVIFDLASAVIKLVAGIVGVVNWNKLHKATSCIVWGILVIALCVVTNILIFSVDSTLFNALSLLTGLVVPVLYLIGAFKNKNAANAVAAGGSNFNGTNNVNL